MFFNIKKIKSEFPILSTKVNGYPLIYFDSAASAQKPISVINAEKNFYEKEYAAVHRGIHTLSANATSLVEKVRSKVANFINASCREIIFVKGTTEGINLVANILEKKILKNGDNIVITQMEHHSNIIPWQIISRKKKIEIRIIPITKEGELDLSILPSLIDKKTKILSIIHVSNVLGTINPIRKIINKIKKNFNVITLVDGAQAIMHEKIDVKKIGCDFYVFSGHKIYGPTGIGVLYGKKEILKKMPPWEGGGAMVDLVSLNSKKTSFLEHPWRFEAGTPNIAGIIGLGAALSFFKKTCIKKIKCYEQKLIKYAVDSLIKYIPKINIYGPKKKRIGVISFNISNYHAYDIGSFLDQYGIAIRTGHHCAMPIMNFYKVSSMSRLSLAIYNDKHDIDYFISRLIYICSLMDNLSNNKK